MDAIINNLFNQLLGQDTIVPEKYSVCLPTIKLTICSPKAFNCLPIKVNPCSYNVISLKKHAATFADFVRLPFTLGRYIDRLVRL